MNKERLKKIESESKKILSNIIFEESSEIINDFGIITVTDVKISADFSYVDVFVSSIKNGEMLTKKLAKINNLIQSRYNKSMKLRKFPKIRYRYDAGGEKSQDILETLKEIKNNEEI